MEKVIILKADEGSNGCRYAPKMENLAFQMRTVLRFWGKANRRFKMPNNSILSPESEETARLIEMHRELMGPDGIEFAREQDTYSLAQPSPFRFVPMIASNQTAPLHPRE